MLFPASSCSPSLLISIDTTTRSTMSTPPQPPKADAGMEKLFSRLPGLIEQARKGTMMPQAITQVSPSLLSEN